MVYDVGYGAGNSHSANTLHAGTPFTVLKRFEQCSGTVFSLLYMRAIMHYYISTYSHTVFTRLSAAALFKFSKLQMRRRSFGGRAFRRGQKYEE